MVYLSLCLLCPITKHNCFRHLWKWSIAGNQCSGLAAGGAFSLAMESSLHFTLPAVYMRSLMRARPRGRHLSVKVLTGQFILGRLILVTCLFMRNNLGNSGIHKISAEAKVMGADLTKYAVVCRNANDGLKLISLLLTKGCMHRAVNLRYLP